MQLRGGPGKPGSAREAPGTRASGDAEPDATRGLHQLKTCQPHPSLPGEGPLSPEGLAPPPPSGRRSTVGTCQGAEDGTWGWGQAWDTWGQGSLETTQRPNGRPWATQVTSLSRRRYPGANRWVGLGVHPGFNPDMRHSDKVPILPGPQCGWGAPAVPPPRCPQRLAAPSQGCPRDGVAAQGRTGTCGLRQNHRFLHLMTLGGADGRESSEPHPSLNCFTTQNRYLL